ncbi:cache domain-containing protein [Ideonella livida]|uniref:histidine kinase n=1 Tax=Ideonella livida TaxID=2707176 RepID=A0A7C9TJ91_9BURK|nr:cache domain-containing protein [Ideonella livida]NDY91840.1 HAMP domain-containing protein [Ideonella livida]
MLLTEQAPGQRRRSGRLARLPIRSKLLMLVLVPLGVVLPLLGLLLLGWSSVALDRLLVAKVRADLAVAHGYFERLQARVGASTRAVAESHALHLALDQALDPGRPPPPGRAANALPPLPELLAHWREREGLDFAQLLGPDGRPLAHDAGLDLPALPLPAGQDGPAAAQLVVLSPQAQAALPPALRARVAVALRPTDGAQPSARTQEDRALLLLARVPVRPQPGGAVRGHLLAGVLLNRNLDFIDQLNDIVYPAGSLPWGSHGTATLFLDDVRVSTNVRLFGQTEASAAPEDAPGARAAGSSARPPTGERAIGTRVSATVRQAVLDRGDTWLDRAFVVNAWYVSGYLPLADAQGQRVGMLYVGFLERPFTWLKYGVLAGIGLVFFLVMTGAAWVCLRWARRIAHPLERMNAVMQQVEDGQGGARVGPVGDADEIGHLAAHLDHLLDVVADKTAALERWNAALDAKVAERTRELQERTHTLQERTDELQATQRQLLRQEKLAAVGQLTASIAHEVNNPIAVIQGNLDLARELLGAQARPVQAELDLIDRQIERMRLIVTRLLQFARPGDYAGYVEAVDLAQALDDALVLAGHHLSQHGIAVQRRDGATRPAPLNRQELQQVLVNLLVNAAQAMPTGGALSLETADWGAHGVVLRVADTGPGLPADLLDRPFQPFSTRKPEGTGLGLWISHSLLERYGGELRAANRPGGGAELSVWLPGEGTTPASVTDPTPADPDKP